MTTRMQQGYLVLADISGYTSFMARTELDHAHEILGELLELVVQRLKPLALSKLEGDAVFAYAAESELPQGEMLLDIIETCYVAFRDRLMNMQRSTTCECKACRAMPALDLKFIAHYGAYILQTVAGNSEVVGSDVNLVHRLLKNGVVEQSGWRAYALFTAPCLQQIGLPREELLAQVEEYEHLGQIATFSFDLRARYKEIVEGRQIKIAPGEADVILTHDFAAPPHVVWDWLTSPEKKSRWSEGAVWSAGARPKGRSGVGARNHCAHGKALHTEEILDWRPFDYCTIRQVADNGMPMEYTMTFVLEPTAGGTRMQATIKGKMPVPGFLNRPMCNLVFKRLYDLRRMFTHIDAQIGTGAVAAPVPA